MRLDVNRKLVYLLTKIKYFHMFLQLVAIVAAVCEGLISPMPMNAKMDILFFLPFHYIIFLTFVFLLFCQMLIKLY